MEKEEKIAGRNPIKELLVNGNRVRKIFIGNRAKGAIINQIKKIAAHKGVAVKLVETKEIDQAIPQGNHQNIYALIKPFQIMSLTDFIAQKPQRLVLALDQVQDPQNVGSIIRSAAFLGAEGVLIPRQRSAPLGTTVLKVSAGALERVPLLQGGNLVQDIELFKENGFWVFGADVAGTEKLWEVDFRRPSLIIIGSEGKGLRRLVKEKCDHLVKIPSLYNFDSLNAAVASAVMMYEVLRQQKTNS